MADYNINAITRRVVFTGSAGVGPYAFSFEVLDQNDVAVYFNTTSLTLTTDYTVTINANGTGSVTLVTGSGVPTTPTASDTVIIIGARDIERVTDFVTAGDLLASSLNEQLDALTIINQQLAEEGQRSMRAPVYDPALVADGGTLDMTLPAKADRVDAVLAFDTDGNPTKGPTVSGITTVTDLAADIATLADIEDGTVATDAISNTAAIASDVTTVGGIASNVTTVAGISADVTTVANNVSGVNSFAQKYRIGASDPTTSLDEGDLFYNTTDDQLKVYNGTAWETGVEGASGLLSLTGGTMTGDIVFSGTQVLQTANEILTEIKTVDGTGSGLDADTVDGVEASSFMLKSADSSLDMNGNTITDAYNVSIQNNLVHEGDTNTYLGFGNNTLNFYANGIRKMVIDPTSVDVTGTLSATALTGDGSGLTNLPGSYSDSDVDTHLNTSTASASEVLSWTGSDYDWVSTGIELYAENFTGSGTNLPSATGSNSVAVGYEAEADSLRATSFGSFAKATNQSALALGASNASGISSLSIATSTTSTAYGAASTSGISIGTLSKASSIYGMAIGTYQAFADQTYSIALGAETNAADIASVAIGRNATSSIRGKFAFNNNSNVNKPRQGGYYILSADTVNATTTAITSDHLSPLQNNQIILDNNSAYSFNGTIIARESAAAGSDYASWEIKGALLRDANAASTVLGNGIVNKLYATSGASSWAVSLIADTTYGGLKIQVTGAASTSIRWAGSVSTTEVTYA